MIKLIELLGKEKLSLKNQLTILQINDVHGYLDLHPELYYKNQGIELRTAGGYSRIKTIVENIRKENGQVLFLDNGDTLHGTYEAVESEGESLVPILNNLGLDAMTFHWDIAYGPDILLKRQEELNYPILAINAYDKDTHELYTNPYVIKDIQGIRVGIIGIACNIIDKTMPKKFSEGLYFTNGSDELPKYLKEARENGAEVTVVLSHLGFPQDVKLIEDTPGIDVVISGHTHNRLEQLQKVNDTYIMQSGSHGSFVGKLTLTLFGSKPVTATHELIHVEESIVEDKTMKKLVHKAMEPHIEKLSKVVGKTEVVLHRGNALESPMDNLLLSSMLEETGAELAFSNGWRYGAPVPQGDVTLRHLHQIIPVNPPVSTVDITGAELLAMMEENLENTYARDPFAQMGGYVKRCLGLKIYMKIENEKGRRIQKFYVGDQELDLTKTYKACYVTNQGVPNKYGVNHKKTETLAIEALEKYLKNHSFNKAYHETFVVI
ncbi:MAG: bifunctional metallophosphatase/5'-nucleotidase [Clostridium sp.]|jgi:2',3'-cyclic-nucleotide 2'-phosphodiesterase (5'-nucleotidase family)|nr:bifunctional metallophosphatase/5'-nucleotidase [Clostridium sp.]